MSSEPAPWRRYVRQGWMLACLAGALVYLAYYVTGPGATGLQRLAGGHRAALLVALALQLAQLAVTNRIWAAVVSGLAGVRIGWLEAFAHMALVNLGRYLPGKVWGAFARLASLAERGVPPAQGVAATVTEQLALLQGSVMLGLLLLPVVVPVPRLVAAGCWILVALAIALAPWLLAQAQTWARRWPALAERLGPAGSVPVGGVYRRAVLAFVVAWACNGCVLYALQLALFDGPAGAAGLALALLANVGGAIAGAIALFAPGGIGVRESAAAGVLALALRPADAVLLMVVMRLWMVLADGALALALTTRVARR